MNCILSNLPFLFDLLLLILANCHLHYWNLFFMSLIGKLLSPSSSSDDNNNTNSIQQLEIEKYKINKKPDRHSRVSYLFGSNQECAVIFSWYAVLLPKKIVTYFHFNSLVRVFIPVKTVFWLECSPSIYCKDFLRRTNWLSDFW